MHFVLPVSMPCLFWHYNITQIVVYCEFCFLSLFLYVVVTLSFRYLDMKSRSDCSYE